MYVCMYVYICIRYVHNFVATQHHHFGCVDTPNFAGHSAPFGAVFGRACLYLRNIGQVWMRHRPCVCGWMIMDDYEWLRYWGCMKWHRDISRCTFFEISLSYFELISDCVCVACRSRNRFSEPSRPSETWIEAQALRTMHENITVTDMKCLVPIFEDEMCEGSEGRTKILVLGRNTVCFQRRIESSFCLSWTTPQAFREIHGIGFQTA